MTLQPQHPQTAAIQCDSPFRARASVLPVLESLLPDRKGMVAPGSRRSGGRPGCSSICLNPTLGTPLPHSPRSVAELDLTDPRVQFAPSMGKKEISCLNLADPGARRPIFVPMFCLTLLIIK